LVKAKSGSCGSNGDKASGLFRAGAGVPFQSRMDCVMERSFRKSAPPRTRQLRRPSDRRLARMRQVTNLNERPLILQGPLSKSREIHVIATSSALCSTIVKGRSTKHATELHRTWYTVADLRPPLWQGPFQKRVIPRGALIHPCREVERPPIPSAACPWATTGTWQRRGFYCTVPDLVSFCA
jgi:hypothetical protein